MILTQRSFGQLDEATRPAMKNPIVQLKKLYSEKIDKPFGLYKANRRVVNNELPLNVLEANFGHSSSSDSMHIKLLYESNISKVDRRALNQGAWRALSRQ